MTTARFARLAPVVLAVLALVAGCGTPPPAPTASPATAVSGSRPRLVVVLVIDGLPQRQVTGYRDQLGTDGLNRFLERGAWYADAHFGQAVTLTGPGHAVLLTGAYPNATGIIGNDWRDASTGRSVYCVADAEHRYLDHTATGLHGSSPKNLLAESLGDVLRRADPRSKVIAVSGKDRAAILLAGRAGTAYVFVPETGAFATTTYYLKEHPAWVADFNRTKPADRYFKAVWSPLLPEMAYARSEPDNRPWYSGGGRLPKVIGEGYDAPGPKFYGNLLQSPFFDALLLDFARAAIEGEALGQDDVPDILAVSLSAHDYVNHAWGPESRLSHDHVLQIDELLAGFFHALDRRIGPDNYVVVATADHGFMPVPEYLQSRGEAAGRQNSANTLANLGAGLSARFGEGRWVRGWSAQSILFDRALMARRGVDPAEIAAEAKRILLAEPGVEAVYTRAEIESESPTQAPHLDAVRKGWHRRVSGDLQVLLKPRWIYSSSRRGTTHGSHHAYDTHVPILFYGPKWVKPGRHDARVEVADIAPTLARLLQIPPPSSSEGRPLPLAP